MTLLYLRPPPLHSDRSEDEEPELTLVSQEPAMVSRCFCESVVLQQGPKQKPLA